MFDITSPAPVLTGVTGIAQCSGMQLADINNLFIVISTYRYGTSTGTVLLVRYLCAIYFAYFGSFYCLIH